MSAKCHRGNCRVRLKRMHLTADPATAAPDSIDTKQGVECGSTKRNQPYQSHPADGTADFTLRGNHVIGRDH